MLDEKEFWETVCVLDVIPMNSDEVLTINEVQFEPFEKLSDLRDGTLGLLTGMTSEQFKQILVKETLRQKIDSHLRDLVRRGFYVAIVGDLFVKVYKQEK